MQVHYISELARLARDVGGSIVRVFTGYENPAADLTRQQRLIIDSLREASRRAAEFGVTIGVQNHHDIGVGYESLHDLLMAVNEPNCRALFDAWAPALQGEDLAAAARHLAPLTVHTTIADYQRRARYKYDPALVNYTAQTPYAQAVPMGEGFIDYRSFLKALKMAVSRAVSHMRCARRCCTAAISQRSIVMLAGSSNTWRTLGQ